ncbi:YdeI/OmpD-associated family protein [Flavobacterium sp.]|uniref:YdeI/OmpD-associated family protein n=1 Tax=Flavobacterium sp. TaxID=239 RepID=UPI00262EFEE5|nr:YdeI/OmpD-associated family protein [Flavobacterium sp.]
MKEEKNPWNKTNQWEEEINLIVSIIAKTELVEMTKWGGPVYTIDNKNVVGVGGFKSYLGIWFFNGVFMKDEAKVLVNAQEGVTKALRQWRFKSKEEILKHEKLILQYIQEAIANEKAGISKKPEKKAEIISELLNEEFKKDTNLAQAFDSFSPYKQREFLEYVETAKQEKTKLTRIDKIKPMILDRIGLNDKYR